LTTWILPRFLAADHPFSQFLVVPGDQVATRFSPNPFANPPAEGASTAPRVLIQGPLAKKFDENPPPALKSLEKADEFVDWEAACSSDVASCRSVLVMVTRLSGRGVVHFLLPPASKGFYAEQEYVQNYLAALAKFPLQDGDVIEITSAAKAVRQWNIDARAENDSAGEQVHPPQRGKARPNML
jgi:hypothetical protein